MTFALQCYDRSATNCIERGTDNLAEDVAKPNCTDQNHGELKLNITWLDSVDSRATLIHLLVFMEHYRAERKV